MNAINKLQIGSVTVSPPVFLAPMAGVSDLSFRILSKEMGCGLVCSEMVSAKGLIYENEKTQNLLKIDDREQPVSIQIFGSEPTVLAQAARKVQEAGAAVLDINMGCPTPKITNNGDGSALMKNPSLAYEIIARVVAAVSIPVTVKIRAGWDREHKNAAEIARLADKAGAAAIAVHGRTREEFYTGQADWDIVRQVKDSVTIPVIGNGDIRTPEQAGQMLLQTGCDGIMIGRGAQGNPWIFKQISRFLQTGELLPGPDMQERIDMALRHLHMLIKNKGEYIGIREMRSHAAWYTKGLPHSAELRQQFNQAVTVQDFSRILKSFSCDR